MHLVSRVTVESSSVSAETTLWIKRLGVETSGLYITAVTRGIGSGFLFDFNGPKETTFPGITLFLLRTFLKQFAYLIYNKKEFLHLDTGSWKD